MKLWQKSGALLFALVLSFSSCKFGSSDSYDYSDYIDEKQYGTLTIGTENSARQIISSEIVKADVTVSGFGMTTISKNDVEVLSGSGNVTIEKIPVGKNRIITIEAKRTIDNVLSKIDGVVIRNIVDINAGNENATKVNWSSTALGNVYAKLLSEKYDISSLNPDDVKALIPSDVHSSLVDTDAIALDIKAGTKEEPSKYKLKSSAVTFSVSNGKSDFAAQITDPSSKKLDLITTGEQTISNVAPGNWNFYIINSSGTIVYSEKLSVKSEESISVNGGEAIILQVPSPRLEDSTGKEIVDLSISSETTFYLSCRTLDGENPFDADIYYTLDGTEPSSSSTKYDSTKGITVSGGKTLKAIAIKDGYESSEVKEWTFEDLSNAKIGERHPKQGNYSLTTTNVSAPTGASISDGNATFVLYSKNAEKVLLELYSKAYGEEVPVYDYWMEKGTDDYWRVTVKGVPENTLYAFRVWGPNWTYNESWTRGGSSAGFVKDFDENGNRFNPNKVLFDPYAKEISHDKSNPEALKSDGKEHGGNIYSTGETTYTLLGKPHREVDTAFCAPKSVLIVNNDKNYGTKPAIPAQDASIYEAHARGITKHSSSASLASILSGIDGFENVRDVPPEFAGTYKGAAYLAPYLKALGINTIELLPVHESDNDANPDNQPGGNYWAYMTYGFFAPDRRYSSDKSLGGPTREFKDMVKTFHDNGMEVYLDVVYNHSGEGGTYGKDKMNQAELTFMRGIDNSTYYSLVQGAPESYWETTGCGNNLQCDNPIVRQFILDSLTYWIDDMGVDGFRFDLATVLGREKDGSGNWNYNPDSKTLKEIVSLGESKDVEMIAESWDTGDGSYQVGNFPKGWGGWNGDFRDAIRSYVNTGNRGSVNDYINGDYHKFNKEGGPHKSINFVVAHDGFTLADLVSYDGAGNAKNKQDWPFGPSDGGSETKNSLSFVNNTTEETKTASKRQAARNYIAIQMMSRGVPMIVWGDEFSRTQNGNNNPYNVDSVATWSNYNMINSSSPHTVATGGKGEYDNNFGTFNNNKSINGNFMFMKYMLNLRASEPALRQTDYSVSYEFKKEDGYSTLSGTDKCVWIRINGSSVNGGSDYLVFMNMHTDKVSYAIPAPLSGYKWIQLVDTDNWAEGEFNCWSESKPKAEYVKNDSYGVNPWSVVIFKQVSTSETPIPSGPKTLSDITVSSVSSSSILAKGGKATLKVMARYSDGSSEDITGGGRPDIYNK